MHLSEEGFAGELRDKSGVLTKYDDIGCFLQAMTGAHEEFPEAWVEDHSGAGFIPLLSASFTKGGDVKTPMGFGIVAFKDPKTASNFAEKHGAKVVLLEELLKEVPHLVRNDEQSEVRK